MNLRSIFMAAALGAFASTAALADGTIASLGSAAALSDSDSFPICQSCGSGSALQATGTQLTTYVRTKLSGVSPVSYNTSTGAISLVGAIAASNMLGLTNAQIYQGNISNVPTVVSMSGALDNAIGSTRGAILERSSAGWSLLVPSSTVGQVLTSNGSGADPTYQTITGTGTVTSVALGVPGTSIFGVTGSPVTTSGTLALTTTGTSGGIPYFSSTSQLTSTSALTANGVVYGGGAGVSPGTTTVGTAGQVLTSNGSGNAPTFQTISGTGTVTSVTLASGFTTTLGTQNTGANAITTTGTINGQLWPVAVSSSCTVNSTCDSGHAATGSLLIPSAAGVTITLPNPASGTKGVVYNFGSDGTNSYSVTTAGGTATFYGCSGSNIGTNTTLIVPIEEDMSVVDDGTNYKCQIASAHVSTIPGTYLAGSNPNNAPLASFRQARYLSGVRCRPEVLAGGTATITVVKAANGVAISSGTNVATGTCNANTGAATIQDLTLATNTIAAGDTIGIQTAGAGWSGTPVAVGVVEIFVR